MKRLSNKKYMLTKLFWFLVVLMISLMLSMAAKQAGAAEPFCQFWSKPPGEENVTPNQLKMFHLGFFLTRSDFVRITLNKHISDKALVDRTVTCYEEHTPVLVDQVNDLCMCSMADKKDEMIVLWNNYINDCLRESSIKK